MSVSMFALQSSALSMTAHASSRIRSAVNTVITFNLRLLELQRSGRVALQFRVLNCFVKFCSWFNLKVYRLDGNSRSAARASLAPLDQPGALTR